ncbi:MULTISPECIES: hypothetical protein [Sorangium]|uniref:Uncharacterized protein n=1 Tax=Sorangium cellulosum (strain So ce56) TaxID=448385 RepID=A9FA26_SORC5|nr:hypothetical protein [Sorangium cellulosum]CAN94829.1 hypothetical protein sce4666 [Sorangium cellulosum So ce56]
MTAGRRRSPGAAAIGAFFVGLLAVPWIYVTFGALSAFSSPFPEMATLLLIVATLDLGLETFVRPRGFGPARLVGAAASAVVLLALLAELTKFTWQTMAQRAGLFATVWLGATVVWLIVTLLVGEVGPEAILRPRLTSSARQWGALVMGAILFGTLTMLSWAYLTPPPAIIGALCSTDQLGERHPGFEMTF